MIEFNFNNDNVSRHQCIGVREGDWLIFKCSECDYIRKVNTKTGKSKTYNSNFEVLHQGTFNDLAEPEQPIISPN